LLQAVALGFLLSSTSQLVSLINFGYGIVEGQKLDAICYLGGVFVIVFYSTLAYASGI